MQSVPFTDADKRMSDFMETAWVNFARTGNPNGSNLSLTWPRFSVKAQNYVELGDTDVTVGSGWRDAQIDFIGHTLRR
jgi:carboxylesterase type B